MKLSALAKAIGAKLQGADVTLPPIVIDSRKISAGDFFVALKGENHDGHDYIAGAIAQGAKVVLANRGPQNDKEKAITFLQVPDTIEALGKLAAVWRTLYPVPMVGITGSCGKTTVKGMTESICAQQGKVLATKGNFNNHIGLPLTLLRLDASYDFAVIEMGANHAGEIAYLGKIAKPTISLITNVLPAHLQGFKTVAGVAKAKGEIYEILPPDGIAIINAEEAFVDYWHTIIGERKIITYGLNGMVHASAIELHPFYVSFTLHLPAQHQRVKINIPGQHTVMNALAAASAGFALGFNLEAIVKGLEAFQGVPGRLRSFTGFNQARIIDDSYNANPGSMKAALEVLAQCEGERLFVMGDMGELGEDSITYHAQIGEFAREKKIERLLAVGKLTEHAVKAFGQGAKMYPSKEALVDELKISLNAQATILIKGSRSAGMEVVTQALTIHEE